MLCREKTMTIKALHEALKNKKVSAREVVISYLDKIKEKNGELNVYLEVFENDALKQAKEIDERIASGETPGELWGVPLAIKDNILIRGKIASAASKILGNYVASYDACVVEKLKKAGAIFLGRTNMDEFAMGSSTENSAYGPTKNPREASRVPGGSSGGSAAAVAGGLAMAALGSDTGGSIRQPAAFCGVVGLKPTYGAVSRYGLIAMASSLDQIGPIAQTVEDAEILFKAIRGKDEMDSTSLEIRNSKLEIKKIGIPKEYFSAGGVSAFGGGDSLDPQIQKTIDEIVKKLSQNYEIREISLPHTKYALACYYVIMPAEVSSNMARYDGIRYGVRQDAENLAETYKKSRGSGIGLEVRRRILLGTYVLSAGYYDAYYARAQKVRCLIAEEFKSAFEEVDVILAPTAPTPPFKIGEKINDPLTMYLSDIYTIPANLAGVPALTLPSGAQLVAPHFEEKKLFEVGKFIEHG
ncbi:glutaminyl-tRNA synthase (glutamine-hydrolyzing) subunit A [Candidatus Giovannonibacteria bacterium RIFCSPLOWO2_01_FULL_44_40]|uniref:Glutamyl-tRNA(Gln) amidotransferase subunit A n=1 Tax=Candidatus Giovannonibacteria bacterium RIFCSPHIGHO2_01_FULL_45_23 TaxID=1798325 RepID=A0A1F5VFJ6_9BACT|nr:MAG: glutaminyl-tRNA synthase (glutamine-hydrolyzing) subunit A [Candidatus Giovannonibacteria bacterium RIFCSPHIGHO2_01_FULL_45_23]OGF75138.1 MAG: glutaminyl-tRNA synthase (glutamine-hydrolyzing) subunit A [Candidatus Giovannonibacteria bacterium RIFCSPHIGHO2_02_FULL_45_13]OGF79702.1 MAG: glutaminyl-tRNA synthase (glutamine-hydrolyzing) subunit A [Candidatus Giovannonibacteria bacterium RIFCSPLOWO2_01_FULL_44_40]